MIKKEVNDWLKKVENRQYSLNDAMFQFLRFSPYLTREEMKFVKSKIEQSYS